MHVQIQIPIRLNDGQLLLVKSEELETPPRPGDRLWDLGFTGLMSRCGNTAAEITVAESGVDLDEDTVVLDCQEIVLDAMLRQVLTDSAFEGWGNDYEFELN